MPQFPLVPSSEATELADDIRQLFADISRTLPRDRRALSGECHPALDVRETDDVVEVTVDVAGVPTEAIRVLLPVANHEVAAASGCQPRELPRHLPHPPQPIPNVTLS